MANIPVNANDRFVIVTATSDGQTDFDFDFLVFDAEQVGAVLTDVSAGTEAELSYPGDFSVSGLNNANGGTITLIGQSISTGDKVLILGATPIKRLSDFQQAGDYKADTVNREEDLQTMMMQEMQRDIDRTPKAAFGDPPIGSLPAREGGKALVWDENENKFINASVGEADIAVDVLAAQAARDDAEVAAAASSADRQLSQTARVSAQSARDGAVLAVTSSGVHVDTTLAAAIVTGLAAASEGDVFHASGDDVTYVGVYKDLSGVAVEQARYPKSALVDDIRSSLMHTLETIGVSGAITAQANASFGTYTHEQAITKAGTGIRYEYNANNAGTIHVQIVSVSGDTKTIIDEREIVVSGAGAGVAEFLDLSCEVGQYVGVRASPSGTISAMAGADPAGGWWFTTAPISKGGTYDDATLTTTITVNHRFSILGQVVTGDAFADLQLANNGGSVVIGSGDAATFHAHLVLGESHAAGVPIGGSSITVPVGRGYCYRRATETLGDLQDPTGNSASAIASNRGSPFVAFGSQVLSLSANAKGALVVNSGDGGTTAFNHWASGGASWLQAVDDWGKAMTAAESDELIISGKSISIILGSNDAAVGTSKADFKAAILSLIARGRTLVNGGDDVPVVLMETGPFTDGSYAAAVAYIQEAQQEIVRENDNVFMGYSARYAVAKGQMIDNLHMTQEFYDIAGASLAVSCSI